MAPPGDTPPVVCATPLPGAGPPWVPSLAVAPGDPALTAAPGDTPSLACSALAGFAGFSFWTAVFGATGRPAAGPDVEPAVWAVAGACCLGRRGRRQNQKHRRSGRCHIVRDAHRHSPGTVRCNANHSPGYRFPRTPRQAPAELLANGGFKHACPDRLGNQAAP